MFGCQMQIPTTHVVQTPNFGLQAHFLGDGQAVREQSANEDLFELWNFASRRSGSDVFIRLF